MNRTLAAVALSLVAVSSAYADDITIDNTPFVSTLSRAQVNAQLQQFQRSGVNPWALQYDPRSQFHSTATREQVRAEYLKARAETAALTGEDSGSALLSARARSAASVLAGDPATVL